MSIAPSGNQNSASPSEESQIVAALKDHWRKVGYEFPVKSIERLEEAAKQLVAINGTLQGLYLAVFAFSNLREYAPSPLTLLFLLPMILSVTSIIFAIRVFMLREYERAAIDDVSLDAWTRLSEVYRKALVRKRLDLYRAHWLLIGSFALLIAGIGVALLYPPEKSTPTPTQIMIVTPTATSVPAPTSAP